MNIFYKVLKIKRTLFNGYWGFAQFWCLFVQKIQIKFLLAPITFLTVLLHRDQHFIERESYRSGREMALEIQDKACTISPLRCVMANRASGPSFQLSLIPSRCREEGVSSTSPSGSLDLEEGGLSARSCLRDSQAICSFQESLETIICNEDIDNKDRNHLQRTGGVS